MSNGGVIAQRGFIFQSIIAMIECLERNDWDAIKLEPETKNDKVDIILYQNGRIKSAIQVKSSTKEFQRWAVSNWLDKLKNDAEEAEEYGLCLVGDLFSQACKEFIKENQEVTTVSPSHLSNICTGAIAGYVRQMGLGEMVSVNDLERIDDTLFSKIHKNSIADTPLSRDEFEKRFNDALSVHPFRKSINSHDVLPPIREKKIPPCEPFVEGTNRTEDLSNIANLLANTDKPLWLYGESGIGKTELLRRFAALHSEYEYVFANFRGSINQTVSQNLFFLKQYEMNGTELTDVVRYEKNMATFSQYSDYLALERRSLVLIIDNYDPYDHLKEFREETELDIHSGFSGEKNDIKELLNLLKAGLKILLMAQKKPLDSDYYATYEIRGINEEENYAIMTGYFTKIVPFIEKEGIREKLLSLIRIAENRTVFINIMALAMQNSKLDPEKALNNMLETLDSSEVYFTRYSSDSLTMQGHLEKILRFLSLSYQEKQMLTILTMLPLHGMNLEFFKKLTASSSAQLGKLRQTALQRLLDNNVIIEEVQAKEIYFLTSASSEDGNVKIIRMSPLIANHTLSVLGNNDTKTFLNTVHMNWIDRLIHFVEEDTLESLKIGDDKFKQLPMLVEACLAAEQMLKKFGECLGCEDKVVFSRKNLLMKASEVSDKVGNIKDSLEYLERALSVGGMSVEDMYALGYRLNNAGLLYYKNGKYNIAKQCFIDCLQVLNDKNFITTKEVINGPNLYDIEELMQLDDVLSYATLFNNLGSVYHSQRDYENTLAYYGKALAIHESVFGPKHPDTASSYNNMAGVYEDQGDYGKALEYYGKALAIREKAFGTEHPDTASSYNNIAGVFHAQGDYQKALRYYGKACASYESVFGTVHPITATSYNNMALIYSNQGDYKKALEYYGKALAIRENVFGTEHPDTASSYNNMAGVHARQGDYQKALENYRKALAIKERVFGTGHINAATTYNNLADVFRAQGDYQKALEYFGKACASYESVFGTEHPFTATSYNNMATVYEAQGNYGKSLEYFRKALAIQEKVLGTEHPDTATTYSNMASVHARQGDYQKALEYFGKALAIHESVLGTWHPETASLYNNIASVYKDQRDYQKALEHFRKALVIQESVLRTEHPLTATIYNNIASVYKDQHDYQKALEHFRKALVIQESVLGTEHPLTATIYNNIAGVYKDQGDYQRALKYYGKALVIQERVFGMEHPDTATMYSNIAYVYKNQRNYQKAQENYRKAFNIFSTVLGKDHPYTKISHDNMVDTQMNDAENS